MRFPYIFVLQFFGALVVLDNYSCVCGKTVRKRGVMDNFNDGLKFAGQMFGINTAADVANLVAKAFSTTATRNQHEIHSEQVMDTSTSNISGEKSNEQETDQHNDGENPTESQIPGMNTANLIAGILKMIGFDARKLGALAINALILVAQAIGTTLMPNTTKRRRVSSLINKDDDHFSGSEFETNTANGRNHETRGMRAGNPIDWFLENPNKEMRALLGDVTDEKLSDKLTNMIEGLEMEAGEGDCIRMLMCKSAPFIWGMQKSLDKRLAKKTSDQMDPSVEEQFYMNTKGFFIHLPSIKEFRKHGAQCEKRYANTCNTTIF